jgi:hypothetical protein
VKARPCRKRCRELWAYGHGKSGWRDLPPDLRQVWLAAADFYSCGGRRHDGYHPIHGPSSSTRITDTP